MASVDISSLVISTCRSLISDPRYQVNQNLFFTLLWFLLVVCLLFPVSNGGSESSKYNRKTVYNVRLSAFPETMEELHVCWPGESTTCLPSTSRAALPATVECQVRIRRWLVSTTAIFQTKRRLRRL
jgi:hypothetical protein